MKKLFVVFVLIFSLLLGGIGCLFFPPVQKALILGILGDHWGKVELDSIEWGLDGGKLQNFSIKNDDFSISWDGLLVETSLLEWLSGDILALGNVFWQGAKFDFSQVNDWESLQEKYLIKGKQSDQEFLGLLKSLEQVPQFSLENCSMDLMIHLPKKRVIKLTIDDKTDQGLKLSVEEPNELWRFSGELDWERTDLGQWKRVTLLGELLDSDDRKLITKGNVSADQQGERYQLEWNAPDHPSFSGKLFIESGVNWQNFAFNTTGLLPFSVVKMGLPILNDIGSFVSLSWQGKGKGVKGKDGLTGFLEKGQFTLKGSEGEVVSANILQPFPVSLDLNQIPEGEFLDIKIENQLLDPLATKLDQLDLSGKIESLGIRVSHQDGTFLFSPSSRWKLDIDRLFIEDSMILEKISLSTKPTIELKEFSSLAIFLDQTVFFHENQEILSGSFGLTCDLGLLGAIENTKLHFKGSGDTGLIGKQPLLSKIVGGMEGKFQIQGNLKKDPNELSGNLNLAIFSGNSGITCDLELSRRDQDTNLDFKGSGDMPLIRAIPLLSKLIVPMDGEFQIQGNLKKDPNELTSHFLGAFQQLQRLGKPRENLTAIQLAGSLKQSRNQWESTIKLNTQGEGPDGDSEFSVQWKEEDLENPKWQIDWQAEQLNMDHWQSLWGFYQTKSKQREPAEKSKKTEEQNPRPTNAKVGNGLIKGNFANFYANKGKINARELTHRTMVSKLRIEPVLRVGSIGGGQISVEASLDLPSSKKPHYQLVADGAFSNLDAAFLQGSAGQPSEAIFTGELSGKGRIKSIGKNLENLASNAHWEAHLKSNGGNFRVFAGLKKRLGAMGNILEGGGNILGDFFSQTLEQVGGKRLNAAWKGATILQNLPFDQLTLSVVQKGVLDPVAFKLNSSGDSFKWESNGNLLWKRKKAWQENRLHLIADLGTRGELAKALDTLGLLAPKGNQTKDGYLLLKDPIEIEGKLGNLLYQEFLSRFVTPAIDTNPIQNSTPVIPKEGLDLLEGLLGL